MTQAISTQAINTTSDTARRSDQGTFPPVLELTRTTASFAPACRKRRVNWAGRVLNATWMALMLSCTVECVSRLLWAVQP